MRNTRNLALNAVVAALYAGVAVWLPSTAFANLRLTTALYVLAVWNPMLILGLALGNALAGIPNGPIDVVMGGIVGALTAWTAWKLGEKWGWVAVLLVPTFAVPLWLSWLFHVPYWVTVVVLVQGQAVSAVLGWAILKSKWIRRMVDGR